MGFPFIRTPNYCGTIISGEAPESDDGKIFFTISLTLCTFVKDLLNI